MASTAKLTTNYKANKIPELADAVQQSTLFAYVQCNEQKEHLTTTMSSIRDQYYTFFTADKVTPVHQV